MTYKTKLLRNKVIMSVNFVCVRQFRLDVNSKNSFSHTMYHMYGNMLENAKCFHLQKSVQKSDLRELVIRSFHISSCFLNYSIFSRLLRLNAHFIQNVHVLFEKSIKSYMHMTAIMNELPMIHCQFNWK